MYDQLINIIIKISGITNFSYSQNKNPYIMLTKKVIQIYYIVYKKHLFKKESYFLSVNLNYNYKEDRL